MTIDLKRAADANTVRRVVYSDKINKMTVSVQAKGDRMEMVGMHRMSPKADYVRKRLRELEVPYTEVQDSVIDGI